MCSVKELEKQQVGIRIPTYLPNDIDEITKKYKVNRSEILIEATKSYIDSVKEQDAYNRLAGAMQDTKLMLNGEIPLRYAKDTIAEMKNELKDSCG